MRIAQAHLKLANNSIEGFNNLTALYEALTSPVVFEVSGRWISERVSFNSRRVMLARESLLAYSVLRIGGQPDRFILYSEQKNILNDSIFTYDYTVLDETDQADVMHQVTTTSASGLEGATVDTVLETLPIHLVRFGQTGSEEADFIHFSRQYAFVPNYSTVTTSHELRVGSDRYVIQEVSDELLCKRVTMIKR
jgi:hypothetical protein